MKLLKTKFKDLLIYQKETFKDNRGYFRELYLQKHFKKKFPFDVMSFSKKNVLRGLHLQSKKSQAKLITVLKGEIFDVAVDIRRGSPTYGQWEGYELTAENGHQLYVPVGFAHGFVTLEPDSEIVYKCTDYYVPETDGAVRWDSCGIDWPLSVDPILSDKDTIAPALADFASPFIYGENS